MGKFFLVTLILPLVFFLHNPHEIFLSEVPHEMEDVKIIDFEQKEPLQKVAPENWWENDILMVEGHGLAPSDNDNLQAKKILAKRAAIVDGYRYLAEIAGKVQITSQNFLTEKKIDAVVKGAEVISESYDEEGNCTVVLRVPIYGVTNSFAKAAFAPVDKEDFPAPTQYKTVKGNYTGVIIDCGDLELNPVLSPTIFNAENKSIYSYGNLHYEKVISKGMISYSGEIFIPDTEENVLLLNTGAGKKFTQVGGKFLVATTNENLSRAGDNPLIIKAAELSDDGTCPVIATDDANRILSENLSSHFLDEGAVVFTSNRIRGMRL